MNSLYGTAKVKPQKPVFVIRSLALTRETDETVQRLSGDASDSLGWTVSSSAMVRALLRYVAQQPPSWALSHLFPLVEREIASGLVWGKKR